MFPNLKSWPVIREKRQKEKLNALYVKQSTAVLYHSKKTVFITSIVQFDGTQVMLEINAASTAS